MKTFFILSEKRYFFPTLLAFAFALQFNTLTAVNSILMSLLFFFWIVKILTSEEPVLFSTPLDLPLLGFLIWAGLSLLWTADFNESFNSFIALAKQIFLFYMAMTTIKTKDQFIKLLCIFLAAMLFTDLFAIIDFFQRGGTLVDRHIRAGTVGSNGDSHSLTMLIIMSLPLGFIWGWMTSSKTIKMVLYFFSFISLFALFLGYTRAGWMTIGFQLLILFFFLSRRFFYYLLGFLAAAILISTVLLNQYDNKYSNFQKRLEHTEDTINPFTFETRMNVWNFGISAILKKPILGYGYGREIFQKVYKDNEIIKLTPHLHNMFLETAFELGFPGLILLLSFFSILILQSVKMIKNATDSLVQNYSLFILVMVSGVIFKNLFDHFLVGNLGEFFWVLNGLLFSFLMTQKTSPSLSVRN